MPCFVGLLMLWYWGLTHEKDDQEEMRGEKAEAGEFAGPQYNVTEHL